MLRRINVAQIHLAAEFELTAPICDTDGTKLVDRGTLFSRETIESFHERGIEQVRMDAKDARKMLERPKSNAGGATRSDATSAYPSDSTALAGGASDQAMDEAIEEAIANAVQEALELTSAVVRIRQHGAATYSKDAVHRFCAAEKQALRLLHSFWNDSGRIRVKDLVQLTSVTLKQIGEDRDLLLSVRAGRHDATHYAEQSLYVSKLAVATGMQLGVNAQSLRELQLGCLIHDISMLRVQNPACPHTAPRHKLGEIIEHPAMTLKICRSKYPELPLNALIVASQMHERCDGSGYPRGCKQDKLHPLSKIASVVDMFVALANWHPHREALLPHLAMQQIVEATRRGEFDRAATRALLETVSLYPIRSFVELSDHRKAQVIRVGKSDVARPVVQICSDSEADSPTVVDLSDPRCRVQILSAIWPPQLQSI